MIPGIAPIDPGSILFLGIAALVVLLAWSSRPQAALVAAGAGSLLVALSWLSPAGAAAFAVFLLLPYPMIRASWGGGPSASASGIRVFVTLQIALFIFLKSYFDFSLAQLLHEPVVITGISYVLFRQLHLLIEAPHAGEQPFNLALYLIYLINLWSFLAGPIQRYEDFTTGIGRIGPRPLPEALRDMHRVANGLLKAYVVAPLFFEPSRITHLLAPGSNGLDALVVLYGYPIFLYLNFSGYIDAAIGLARLAGFDTLPENFNRPYLARNVQDFWGRWHISLGVWARAYVFTPLARSLGKLMPDNLQSAALAIAVFVTFLIIGLWHGTTANYVAFGVMQAVGVIAAATLRSSLRRNFGVARLRRLDANPVIHALSVIVCFHYICVSFIFLNNPMDDILRAARHIMDGMAG